MSDTGDDYFTIWYGVYHAPTRQLTYACAGHPPALLYQTPDQAIDRQPAQDCTESVIQRLETEGIAIGMFPNLEFEEATCTVKPNGQLFVFSDGAFEIQQNNGKMWGFDSFAKLLKEYRLNHSKEIDYIHHEIRKVNHNLPFEDDFSLIEAVFS